MEAAVTVALILPEGLEQIEELLPHEQADLAAAVMIGFLLMSMLENLTLPHFALSPLGHAHEAATERARRVGGLSVFIALGMALCNEIR